jgi:sugar phosphate isomerase/epimerase
VQLYTVRDLMKEDFDGTIAKVAQVGYKEVEFAGYFGHTAQQVKDVLQKNGLTAPSTHVQYDELDEKFP